MSPVSLQTTALDRSHVLATLLLAGGDDLQAEE